MLIGPCCGVVSLQNSDRLGGLGFRVLKITPGFQRRFPMLFYRFYRHHPKHVFPQFSNTFGPQLCFSSRRMQLSPTLPMLPELGENQAEVRRRWTITLSLHSLYMPGSH